VSRLSGLAGQAPPLQLPVWSLKPSQLCSSGRSVRAGGRLLVFVVFALRRFLRRFFGRFELFVLAREVGIFLGQTIHFAAEIRVFLLQFRYLRLQLVILLPSLRVLAANQRQTQHHYQKRLAITLLRILSPLNVAASQRRTRCPHVPPTYRPFLHAKQEAPFGYAYGHCLEVALSLAELNNKEVTFCLARSLCLKP